jgi:hypothetical protein
LNIREKILSIIVSKIVSDDSNDEKSIFEDESQNALKNFYINSKVYVLSQISFKNMSITKDDIESQCDNFSSNLNEFVDASHKQS